MGKLYLCYFFCGFLIFVEDNISGIISSDLSFFSCLIPFSGKAAIIEFETKSYEKESGELLCMNR